MVGDIGAHKRDKSGFISMQIQPKLFRLVSLTVYKTADRPGADGRSVAGFNLTLTLFRR